MTIFVSGGGEPALTRILDAGRGPGRCKAAIGRRPVDPSRVVGDRDGASRTVNRPGTGMHLGHVGSGAEPRRVRRVYTGAVILFLIWVVGYLLREESRK